MIINYYRALGKRLPMFSRTTPRTLWTSKLGVIDLIPLNGTGVVALKHLVESTNHKYLNKIYFMQYKPQQKKKLGNPWRFHNYFSPHFLFYFILIIFYLFFDLFLFFYFFIFLFIFLFFIYLFIYLFIYSFTLLVYFILFLFHLQN